MDMIVVDNIVSLVSLDGFQRDFNKAEIVSIERSIDNFYITRFVIKKEEEVVKFDVGELLEVIKKRLDI